MDEASQPLREIPPPAPLPRHDGEDLRRRPLAAHAGAERRIPDPATEQDHPEQFGAN